MEEKIPILHLACYNIRQGLGLDGRFDLVRIGRVIRDLAPDFIGLQEVTSQANQSGKPSQLELLAKETGFRAIGGPTMTVLHGEYGNGLLTHLPVRKVRSIDLSFRKREPRGALDVDVIFAGKKVRIIVTHLGLRPTERRFQVRRLIESVGVLATETVVLMGDFNEWFIHGRPLRWMHRHFGIVHPPPTYPSFCPLLRLDRILVSPQYQLLSVERVKTPETSVASDHLPLKALVQIG